MKRACGVDRTNTDSDEYVFISTEFLRQRNRLIGSLRQVLRDMAL